MHAAWTVFIVTHLQSMHATVERDGSSSGHLISFCTRSTSVRLGFCSVVGMSSTGHATIVHALLTKLKHATSCKHPHLIVRLHPCTPTTTHVRTHALNSYVQASLGATMTAILLLAIGTMTPSGAASVILTADRDIDGTFTDFIPVAWYRFEDAQDIALDSTAGGANNLTVPNCTVSTIFLLCSGKAAAPPATQSTTFNDRRRGHHVHWSNAPLPHTRT
jgi:hypothetical protein